MKCASEDFQLFIILFSVLSSFLSCKMESIIGEGSTLPTVEVQKSEKKELIEKHFNFRLKNKEQFLIALLTLLFLLYRFITNPDPLERVLSFFVIILNIILVSYYIIGVRQIDLKYPGFVRRLEKIGKILFIPLFIGMYAYFFKETGWPLP